MNWEMEILCQITDQEAIQYSEAISNRQTFVTLKNIYLENGENKYLVDIEQMILQFDLEVTSWWEKITNKYGIPYYLDNSLGVDLNKNQVFRYIYLK